MRFKRAENVLGYQDWVDPYEDIEHIRNQKRGPLISVLGSTSPSKPYNYKHGVQAGWIVQEFVQSIGGTMVTGGVHGVGVHSYAGAVRYCKDAGEQPKFFCVIPHFYQTHTEDGRPELYEYDLPDDYLMLAHLFGFGETEVVRGGHTMDERRQVLAAVSDCAVLLNGSGGTLDEAENVLKQRTNLVVVRGTGGIAKLLESAKEFGWHGLMRQLGIKKPTSINTNFLHLASMENLHQVLENVCPKAKK